MEKTKVLITGMAGFIGFSVAGKLMASNDFKVVGFDSINDYYDTELKLSRLKELGFNKGDFFKERLSRSNKYENLQFTQLDLEHKQGIDALFEKEKLDLVVHLAAQAGVRHSLKNPYAYVNSNITGFLNILEACKNNNIQHLIYASSSSVYGLDSAIPFTEDQETNHPVSLYAFTKRSNELMAYTYCHLYKLPVTGLRFFTVYGPWGRPDMSPMLFAKAICAKEPVKVFNHGKMRRDFTYIDDIVEGIFRVIKNGASGYKIYNIGNSKPVDLMDFITLMEKKIGAVADKELLPMQLGDVYETYADISLITKDTGYHPETSLEEGIDKFLQWYLDYYK